MKSKTMVVMSALMAASLCVLSACGNQEEMVERTNLQPSETAETLAVLTETEAESSSETTQKLQTTKKPRLDVVKLEAQDATDTKATTSSTKASTKATTTTTETVTEAPTDPTEEFALSDTEVADKMHEYFSEKGYNDAQIAGIVGNAEVESGLEPSRGVSGGGFGLFQLMDCEQRREMFSAFDAQGVGKYATPDYWALDASDFDTEEDFDTFMNIMLDYTMNPDDPTWMDEIYRTDSPEEAAEIFLVHYERAVNGGSPIEYYAPYVGTYYQATSLRREAARRWYEYFSA